jgi:hypothetical protein
MNVSDSFVKDNSKPNAADYEYPSNVPSRLRQALEDLRKMNVELREYDARIATGDPIPPPQDQQWREDTGAQAQQLEEHINELLPLLRTEQANNTSSQEQPPPTDQAEAEEAEEGYEEEDEDGNGSAPEISDALRELGFQSLGELLNQEDRETNWLVDNLLPVGGSSLVSAKPKVGKSVLARNLALAVARGTLFLNRITERGAVVYLALEEIEEQVKQSFRRMGATEDDQIAILCGVLDPQFMLKLIRIITKDPPALLILDTLFRAITVQNENSYAEMTKKLNPLLKCARETGTHILVTHHARKMALGDPMDAILGSTAIFGSVDTGIMLQKNSDGLRTIWSDQRYGEALPTAPLRFDKDRELLSLGPSANEEPSMHPERKHILETVLAAATPLTAQEVAKHTEKKVSTTRNLLEKLVAAGELAKITGKDNRVRYAPVETSQEQEEERP